MADGLVIAKEPNAAILQASGNRLAMLPAKSLAALGIGIAAIVAVLAAAMLWSSKPDYRVLFSGVGDKDGGAIVAALTQMNIPYQLEGGSTILVPANKVHDARFKLAAQGLPKGGIVGLELMESQKLGTTQFQEQVNFQRGLEGELARSIQTISAVQNARVHLAIPKPSVFLREEQKPTASVMVQLYGGRTLDSAQIAGIRHLVSSSVPNLPVRSVSIVDQNGVLLSASESDATIGLDASQLDYIRKVEQQTSQRIASILDPIVGSNNYRVQVNADIDFTQSESSAETFKPNQDPAQAVLRSQQTSENTSRDGSATGGVPGALTNQPAAAPTAPVGATNTASAGAGNGNTAGTLESRRETIVNYEVDKTTRFTRNATGTIRRLSTAVVLNHRVQRDGAEVTTSPLSQQELEQINALVREAMGFSQQRGDSLNVSNVPFSTPDLANMEDSPLWKDPTFVSIAKQAAIYLGLLILLLLVINKVIKPAIQTMNNSLASPPSSPKLLASVGADESEQKALPDPSSQNELRLNQVRNLAQQDPRAVAEVVKQWVGKNE
jgi:flagellar M-ring protein FliF